MRDFTGLAVATITDPDVRRNFRALDYFLRDLGRGVQRIEKGEVPSGSGAPIPGTDGGGLFFLLAGRPGGQVGYGGTADSNNLTLGSTASNVKGKILLGASSGYDEVNKRLGIETTTPGAKLDIRQPGTDTLNVPISVVSGPGSWTGNDGGTSLWTYIDETVADDTDYIRDNGTLSSVIRLGLGSVTPQPNTATVTFAYRIGWFGTNGGTAGADINVLLVDGLGTTVHTDTHLDFSAPGAHGDVAFTTLSFTLSSAEIDALNANLARWASMSFTISTGGGGVGYSGQVRFSWVGLTVVGGAGVDLIDGYNTAGALAFSVTRDGYVSAPRVVLNGTSSGSLSLLPAAATTTHSLTLPSAQGAANTVLLNNGSGALSWTNPSTLSLDVADNAFTIHDDGTTTKKLAFQCSGITAATTRTLTVPDRSSTIATLDGDQTFTGQNVHQPTTAAGFITLKEDAGGTGTDFFVKFVDPAGNVFGGLTQAANPGLSSGLAAERIAIADLTGPFFAALQCGLSGNRTITFPDATGTVALLNNAQNLSNKTLVTTGNLLKTSTAASGVAFSDNTTAAKVLRFVLSGASSANSSMTVANAAARDYKFGDDTGTVNLVVAPASGTVDLTAQTGNVGATTAYTTVHAGRYRISFYAVFTAVSAAGNLTVTGLWTDPQQAQTATMNEGGVIAYAAAGSFLQGRKDIYATSGSTIQFSTTLTGTGTYNLYVRVESLT